ncbi:serine/threonine-protein kinase [Acanthopleuribacter pedis]|uniref:Serine/threonine protein kinase n=1 Tax=Acanthopleuribacter pedis TaxID=442870 RepID=A0A8J7QA42_9BACT|nr:serine/threonine-protein kinase [Acanthopleuribacter pedis]MBO1321586.1 serine/threonine protein kinase [Acanthopleuribacter pedis]
MTPQALHNTNLRQSSVVDNGTAARASLLGNIGPYQLLEKVGQGGMGLVYKAVRRDADHHYVAVKVMRGMVPNQLMFGRFQQEAEAMARLRHPNIASFIEVGYDAEWRPYLVMEYVDGCPLLTYARQRQLTLAARLRLFQQVCDAMAAAHAQGIVHRDLKPDNILVADTGLGPRVKIIDFGVAKVNDLRDGHPLTQAGAVVGTLSHMSPEQAGFQEGPIDARSDVYTLGLVLYELLVGVLPFDRAGLIRKPLFRQMRCLFEKTHPAPIARLRALEPELVQEIAEARQTTPKLLMKALAGPIAEVIGQALTIDLENRTRDVGALGEAASRAFEQRQTSKRLSLAGFRQWVGLGMSS